MKTTIADITIQYLSRSGKSGIMYGDFEATKEIYDACVRSGVMKGGRKDLSIIHHFVLNGLGRSSRFRKVMLNHKRIFNTI